MNISKSEMPAYQAEKFVVNGRSFNQKKIKMLAAIASSPNLMNANTSKPTMTNATRPEHFVDTYYFGELSIENKPPANV